MPVITKSGLGKVNTNLVVVVAIEAWAGTRSVSEQSGDQPFGMLGVDGEIVLMVDAVRVDEVEHGVVVTGVGEKALEEFVASKWVGWCWSLRGNCGEGIVVGGSLSGSAWSGFASVASVLFARGHG